MVLVEKGQVHLAPVVVAQVGEEREAVQEWKACIEVVDRPDMRKASRHFAEQTMEFFIYIMAIENYCP